MEFLRDMYYSGWASQSQTAINYRGGWSGANDGDHYGNGHTYYEVNYTQAMRVKPIITN